jgi:tetratricopeptide (TPR) repeat protein
MASFAARAACACSLLVALAAGCGHNVPVRPVAAIPTGPSEDEVLYQKGLEAFHLATPEGYDQAAAAFRRASQLKPSNCGYAIHLAEALVFLAYDQRSNSEDFAPRLSEATEILDRSEGNPACSPLESAVDRMRGFSLYLREPLRRTEGVAMVNKAVDLDPNDPLNWIVLSKLEPRDPRNPIQKAVDLAPDQALVQYELGTSLLYATDGFSRARQAFDRALELSPRHFESIIGKVYSFSEDEYSDQTEPLLRKAVEIAPTFLTGRRLLGEYYAGLEETDKAVEQFRAAIGYNARYYPAFLALGRTLLDAQRYDEAEQALASLIQLDVTTPHPPQNAVDYTADCQAHYFLGNVWLARGDLTKTKDEYQRALRDIPNYADALYGMGAVLLQQGDPNGALQRFEQVIREHPASYAGAYVGRATIRFNRRQFADALGDFERAISIFQKQIADLEMKATTDDSKGRQRKAEAERRRALELNAELQRAIDSRKMAAELLKEN